MPDKKKAPPAPETKSKPTLGGVPGDESNRTADAADSGDAARPKRAALQELKDAEPPTDHMNDAIERVNENADRPRSAHVKVPTAEFAHVVNAVDVSKLTDSANAATLDAYKRSAKENTSGGKREIIMPVVDYHRLVSLALAHE